MSDELVHVVREGEWVGRIGSTSGFADWESRIWKLSENSELRAKRDPFVLAPGDEVHLPDDREKSVDAATEVRHTFRKKGVKHVLRVRLLNAMFDPITKEGQASTVCRYEFTGGPGPCVRGETNIDGRGFITLSIPAGACEAQLCFEEDRGAGKIVSHRVKCTIGRLRPMHAEDKSETRITGIQQRLASMGLCPGRIDGILGPRTRGAMRSFVLASQTAEKRRRLGVEELKTKDAAVAKPLIDAVTKGYGA